MRKLNYLACAICVGSPEDMWRTGQRIYDPAPYLAPIRTGRAAASLLRPAGMHSSLVTRPLTVPLAAPADRPHPGGGVRVGPPVKDRVAREGRGAPRTGEELEE